MDLSPHTRVAQPSHCPREALIVPAILCTHQISLIWCHNHCQGSKSSPDDTEAWNCPGMCPVSHSLARGRAETRKSGMWGWSTAKGLDHIEQAYP